MIMPPNFRKSDNSQCCENCEFFETGDKLFLFEFYCRQYIAPAGESCICDGYREAKVNKEYDTDKLVILENKIREMEKQLNWLAEYAAENPCVINPEECPQNGTDECDTKICIQCWREAARKNT